MKRNTLNEMLGSSGTKTKSRDFTLDDLSDLLGEKMPKLEFHPVGRLRLTSALRNRFGDGYKNLPGIENILKEFDREAELNVRMQKMKMIKAEKSKE